MNIGDIIQRATDWLLQLFRPAPTPPTPPSSGNRKVSLIILDPILPTEGGRRMRQVLGWNDPERLVADFISDLRSASYGYANYEISERFLDDEFHRLDDGYTYTGDEFLRCWRARSGFHKPDSVHADYLHLLAKYDLVSKVQTGAIDEVWLMGYPYAGFFESRMAGPGAFWCNGPVIENTLGAARRFVVMGFNFERGVGEMLESYGHRAESILNQVYQRIPEAMSLWQRFQRYDQKFPGQAEVGTVHFAPNSTKDYEWGRQTAVLSHSRAWLSFPDLSAPARMEDCSEWGNGDIRAHHVWWLNHLLHASGQANGISYNWWEYIVDPNQVR